MIQSKSEEKSLIQNNWAQCPENIKWTLYGNSWSKIHEKYDIEYINNKIILFFYQIILIANINTLILIFV
jgi:hypothetical protein